MGHAIPIDMVGKLGQFIDVCTVKGEGIWALGHTVSDLRHNYLVKV